MSKKAEDMKDTLVSVLGLFFVFFYFLSMMSAIAATYFLVTGCEGNVVWKAVLGIFMVPGTISLFYLASKFNDYHTDLKEGIIELK